MPDVINKEVSMVQVTADKIAALTRFTPEEIAVIKNTVAKGTTDTELAFFLSICNSEKLNPMMKEIWCYKDNKNNLLVFTGRDGFLRRAQESQLWNGMTSFEVCENDEFRMDVTTATITHIPNFKNRGKIIGAYAIVKPKGCELPTVEWADFETFNKGWNVWKSDPVAMIKKVAETHALKKAFGITVIQSEYDWDVKDGVAVPLQLSAKNEIEVAMGKLIIAFEDYNGEDKDTLKQMCIDKRKVGEFTLEFAKDIGKQIGVEI